MNRNLTKPSEKMFPSLALQCACKEAAEGISLEADYFPAVGHSADTAASNTRSQYPTLPRCPNPNTEEPTPAEMGHSTLCPSFNLVLKQGMPPEWPHYKNRMQSCLCVFRAAMGFGGFPLHRSIAPLGQPAKGKEPKAIQWWHTVHRQKHRATVCFFRLTLLVGQTGEMKAFQLTRLQK